MQCTLGNQNPGALGAVSLQVRVNTPLANGTVINNAARISDSNGGAPVVATTSDDGDQRSPVHAEQERGERGAGRPVADLHDQLGVTGDEPAASVTITDAVPANTTYVSCTSGCTQAGGVVTWALGARVPGNSGTVQFTVQVVSPLPNGTVINNTARIYDATRNAAASASHDGGQRARLLAEQERCAGSGAGRRRAGVHAELVAVGERSGDGRGDHGCAAGERDVCELRTNGCTQAGGIVTWNLGNAERRRVGLGGGDGECGESAAERDGADEQRAHQRRQWRHRDDGERADDGDGRATRWRSPRPARRRWQRAGRSPTRCATR